MPVKARDIIADFHRMIRRNAENELAPWIDRACKSLVASFGNKVAKDIQAVRAAIASPWSNGQTEGQITKLKLVKRHMYRRGKLDLLQVRLIVATLQNRAKCASEPILHAETHQWSLLWLSRRYGTGSTCPLACGIVPEHAGATSVIRNALRPFTVWFCGVRGCKCSLPEEEIYIEVQ